jgi:hypothetical protein
MKTNNTKLFAASLLALGMATSAQATPEDEPNNSLGAAQGLAASSAHSIEAMMGQEGATMHDDLDFFSFEAKAGDVLDLDIDNGAVDTIIGVFDANGKLLEMQDHAKDIDPGSSSTMDARIDKFVAPADGTYTVGVSNVPRYFVNGGGVLGFFGTSTSSVGSYTLNISGATVAPNTQQINIEVKPGSNELAPLSPRAKGKVPVAIMGSADFDVSDIKQSSLTFGSSGNEKSLSKCQKVIRDINNDGYDDQLCHFENSAAGFKSGDLGGVLKGETDNGIQFEGRALLKVLPSKRQ